MKSHFIYISPSSLSSCNHRRHRIFIKISSYDEARGWNSFYNLLRDSSRNDDARAKRFFFFVERNFPSQKGCKVGWKDEWSGISKKIKKNSSIQFLNGVAQLMSLSIHAIIFCLHKYQIWGQIMWYDIKYRLCSDFEVVVVILIWKAINFLRAWVYVPFTTLNNNLC